jgi:hypothetical protein
MKTTPVLLNFRRNSFFVLLALFLVVFVPIATSPVALAFGGPNSNPFGNGSYFPTEGTFQTTVRGKNLSGVATFSTGDAAASVMPSGSFTVSYQGLTYVGNVDASIDPAASSIAATMEASITRQGSGIATNTISSSYEPTGTQTVSGGTAVVNLPDQVTVVDAPPALPVTTTVSGLTETINLPDTTADTFGWVDEIGTSTYQDTTYASGSFTAKLQNSFPNQIFKGKGKMEFTAINFDLSPPALVTTSVNVSVKGVRISDTAQTFADQAVQAPSIITTTDFVNR